MNEELTPDPTDQTEIEETPKVENPEGVLKKNKELLGKLTDAEKARKELADRVAAFEAAESEREEARLKKNGDLEKLYEKRLADEAKKTAEENAKKDEKYSNLFTQYAEKELQLAIPADVFDDAREDFSIVLRTKYVKPVEDANGNVVWKSLDGLETIDLKTFIPTLETAHGRYFKADNNPGGDAPGNSTRISTGVKRSSMTRAEKTAYISKHGQAGYEKLPL